MKMDSASPRNAIDENRQGWIGRPIDRVEGPLKVSGTAPYADEVAAPADVIYGQVVTASISKGRIRAIDTALTLAVDGVVDVLTWQNAPPQKAGKDTAPQLADDRVKYYGQAVALVLAESFEAAREGAQRLDVRYEQEPGRHSLAAARADARRPPPLMQDCDSARGDVDAAMATAEVALDVTYTTPCQIHCAMEPHAALAFWHQADGSPGNDRLTVYCANQMVVEARRTLASTLGIEESSVRVLSRYIGGGFGSKLEVWAETMLAALAARKLGRPVKVALTRQQLFHVVGHRTNTFQRIRLGADRGGRLSAIAHETWCANQPGQDFYEPASDVTRSLYAADHRLTSHRLAELDLPVATSMRAPGEAVGMLALECAMDELACALDLCPMALRERNEPAVHPETGQPYSTRQLVACMREGARRFGWDARSAQPGTRREGRWLIGLGMSAASRENLLMPSECTATLSADGTATVRMAMTDIGTGSYTVLTQVAAEMLGLPPEAVRMELGDTDFPPAAGSGGSWGAASAGSALVEACEAMRAQLAERAGWDASACRLEGGALRLGDQSRPLASLLGGAGGTLETHGRIEPGETRKRFAQQSYGAHFAEVAVDCVSGEVRVRRMLGVFAAGRILNLKTARSQAIGGMAFGIGSALMEQGELDERYGAFVNSDLAQYHVPAHADVPALDAVFLPESDEQANPLKCKGVGELGICGAGAAVANAVYNACGVRVREFPLTLDKILAGMEAREASGSADNAGQAARANTLAPVA